MGLEPLAAAEEAQLDQEGTTGDLGSQACDEVAHPACGAAGGQQVVVDEHPRTRSERVGMPLERVDSVLEDVLHADRVGRQPPGFASRYEPGAELARQRGAQDE